MQDLVGNNTILCLTETQQKFDKLNVKGDLEKHVCMRKLNSKKGGGIMVLKKKSNGIQITETSELHEDCLILDIKVKGVNFKLIIVYFKSNDSNEKLSLLINNFLEKEQEQPIILVGDFNAHTGLLGERINKNGKILEEIIEKNNLIMLNRTEDCEGKITWEARGLKSAIDYALVNRNMIKYFKAMYIDEQKEMYDLSDHCLMKIDLQLDTLQLNEGEKVLEINCFAPERMELFNERVREELLKINDEEINMEKIDNVLSEAGKVHLKKKIKQKRSKKKKGQQEPIWINKDIRTEIDKRKKYNRLKRNNIDTQIEEKFKKMYLKQKEKVKALIKEETYKHEKKITDEIKKNKSRKIWENINFLRGKAKNKNKTVDVYKNNGEKLDTEEKREETAKFWKEIYQKNGNNIADIWDNSKHEYGNTLESNTISVGEYTFPFQLQEHIDYFIQIPPENQYIMPMRSPKITAKEAKMQISKMKNKKSPGQNGVQAELYKTAVQNNECLGKITMALNNTVQKKMIPESWKSSITKLVPKIKKTNY